MTAVLSPSETRPAKNKPVHTRSGLLLLSVVLLAGVTAWLTLIAINNINDFGTNKALLQATMNMEALIDDPVRGNGLEWRALPNELAAPALIAVIVYQLATVALMWRAVATGIRVLRSDSPGLLEYISRVNHSLVLFLLLFAGFLISGLYFGYWLHLGPVQMVHFTLLIIGALVALLTNLVPVASRALEREVSR
ncbi:DUF2165 family protein [Streptomyces yaizuensis]|uniref:DUF2165 family protein n=1 Tax=Streptomyces yaizuensis TaxID=2989713 RepID=A0ABQ5P9T1_9ACTN|nr:DUF2165 family protein [Streptomyces sp. YSPA8]GLF99333.1 DUF2165 family protein [Streptomyces sp. YSPA8]